METKYTAQRIADTQNGWLITSNETQKQDIVFCRLDENTAEDAVKVLEEPRIPQEGN
tara:strand:- start:556 stop:726 length:171 start_codon:yes stop_codon:yes gene_type:complete